MKKNLFIIVLILVAFISCKNDTKDKEPNTSSIEETKSNIKSILDLEYLNDTLQIAVNDIYVENLQNDNYKVSVEMETPLVEKYSKDYKFYIHCYYHDGLEVDDVKFLPVGTNKVAVDGNTITYSRKFTSDLDFFKVVRYGLLNKKTKQRYFSLKIDSVEFTK